MTHTTSANTRTAMRGRKTVREHKHEQAECALAAAIQRHGHLVRGADILAAWAEANGEPPDAREALEGRWERLLQFAVGAGEAYQQRDPAHREVLWGLRAAGELAAPPPRAPAPRVFGPSLVARGAPAEAAVRRAADRHGRLVTVPEIAEELARPPVDTRDGANAAVAGGTPSPGATFPPGRIARLLEPALAAGRVVALRDGGNVYYGPADAPTLAPPTLRERSDLAQVEEALRRAVSAACGAVPSGAVAATIAAAPDLALGSSTVGVSHHLRILAREGRAIGVRPTGTSRARTTGGRGTRVYYTTPEGPAAVADRYRLEMDRHRRAVQGLWRATGRPFTTRVVRAYAASQLAERYDGGARREDPRAWTNAMLHLERLGELVAFRPAGRRWVRWAPAAAWHALAPDEQARRLEDAYRVVDEPSNGAHLTAGELEAPGGGGDERANARPVLAVDAPARDVAFVSRNENVRTLVALAKREAAIAAGADSALVASRPVTLTQLRDAAALAPHLLGGAKDARILVREAVRMRPGMRRPAVVRAGVVGRTMYVDLELTPEGRALIQLRQLLWEFQHLRHQASLERLREVSDLSDAGVHPMPGAALAAWAMAIARDAARHAALLAAAASRVPLRAEEDQEVARAIVILEERARTAEAVRARYGDGDADTTTVDARDPALAATPSEEYEVAGVGAATAATTPTSRSWEEDPLVIDTRVAWEQVAEVADFELSSPRLLQTRVKSIVPVLRRPDLAYRAGGKSRQVVVFLDRIAFAAYAATRWAGAGWATVAVHGLRVLGASRDRVSLCHALASVSDVRTHAGAAAALALFDDAPSRAALAEYLSCHTAVERQGGTPAPTAALVAAAYGLAPKPVGGLASALAERERAALVDLATTRQDHPGQCARRALAAWDEGWTRRALLQL